MKRYQFTITIKVLTLIFTGCLNASVYDHTNAGNLGANFDHLNFLSDHRLAQTLKRLISGDDKFCIRETEDIVSINPTKEKMAYFSPLTKRIYLLGGENFAKTLNSYDISPTIIKEGYMVIELHFDSNNCLLFGTHNSQCGIIDLWHLNSETGEISSIGKNVRRQLEVMNYIRGHDDMSLISYIPEILTPEQQDSGIFQFIATYNWLTGEISNEYFPGFLFSKAHIGRDLRPTFFENIYYTQNRMEIGVEIYFDRQDGSGWKVVFSILPHESIEKKFLGIATKSKQIVFSTPNGEDNVNIYSYNPTLAESERTKKIAECKIGSGFGYGLFEKFWEDYFLYREGTGASRWSIIAVDTVIDPRLQRLVDFLNAQSHAEPSPCRICCDGDYALIRNGSVANPLDFTLFNTITGHATIVDIFSAEKASLPPLLPVEVHRCRMAGIETYSLVTRPYGTSKGTLVLLHGGPHDHDDLTIHADAQFFAALGFTVVQPNYPGSNNNKKLMAAGNGTIGPAIVRIIEDHIMELEERSVISRQNKAVMGFSWGGTITAACVAFGKIFICGVAGAADVDYPRLLEFERKKSATGNPENYERWQKIIQNPDASDHPADLDERSPKNYLLGLKIPLSLFTGTNDYSVDYLTQTKQVLDLVLANPNIPIRVMTFEGTHDLSFAQMRLFVTYAYDSFSKHFALAPLDLTQLGLEGISGFMAYPPALQEKYVEALGQEILLPKEELERRKKAGANLPTRPALA